jgi:U4/U6 small nuclear ribonucleoprotein PRP3
MGDLGAPSRAKSQNGPMFITKGNQQVAKVNPYLAASQLEQNIKFDEEIYDPTLASRKGGNRKTRELVFNQKGKFIAQANALKQQARIEEMKKRIAMETRKTEIEEAGDKAFHVQPPPNVEWWDEDVLPPDQNTYDEWDKPGRNRIESDDTIITIYVQHPVLLEAPQEAFQPGPKPMMLTKTEQKKVRRQRRMADMKEDQAKIRLGLVEPPPPKVKKSNMMRVLGEQAVKDPTAVEARVNHEITQRQNSHEAANEERKLTEEQRAEKLLQQQTADEAKGVKVCVFRVKNLSSGKHRYQVDIHAKQNKLMGIVVLHPTMNLVIVEGGAHSIKAYKKLMLNRIKWSENTLPLSAATPTTFTGPVDWKESKQGTARNSWLNPMDDDGSLKDLSENRCQLVWEGEERAKCFKRWYSRVCETDGEAREALRRSGMENMWTLARSMNEAM